MKMVLNIFKKAKKKQAQTMTAPVNGKIIPLKEVPDPVFAEKMMGEGIAMVPTDGTFVSPVKGEIVQVAPTKHAIGILAEDGSEILIHIGLETVALKGEGFTVAVKPGDKVKTGQLLVDVDLEYLRTHADHIVTPIVITNSMNSNKTYEVTDEKEGRAGETVVMTVTP